MNKEDFYKAVSVLAQFIEKADKEPIIKNMQPESKEEPNHDY